MFRLASSLSCVLLLCGAAAAQQPFFSQPYRQPYAQPYGRVAAPYGGLNCAGGVCRPVPVNCYGGQCAPVMPRTICGPNGCYQTGGYGGGYQTMPYPSGGYLPRPVPAYPTAPVYQAPVYQSPVYSAPVQPGYYSNPSTFPTVPYYGTSYQDSQLRDRLTNGSNAVQPAGGFNNYGNSNSYGSPSINYDWTPGSTADVGVLH